MPIKGVKFYQCTAAGTFITSAGEEGEEEQIVFCGSLGVSRGVVQSS